MRRALGVVAGALIALGPANRSPAPEILVFAAASLTEPLQALGGAFQARTGRRVALSFGSSGDLARQIGAGAPADVFFSADTARMDDLEAAGLVRHAERLEFLSNTLVVVVPASSRLEVRSPRDLTSLPRIALADPAAVPAGVYAKRWLRSLGLWKAIEPKVVPTLDVRAALAAVERDTVPAAIVYRTDATVGRSIRVTWEVADGPKILYSIAPLVSSKDRRGGLELVRFLAGDAGRAEFRSRGFLVLGAP